MPGRHINDHQMRLYMKSRLTETKPPAAAQAAMSLTSAYRIENDPRLPSQKALPRGRRRPDPLVDIFDPEVRTASEIFCTDSFADVSKSDFSLPTSSRV